MNMDTHTDHTQRPDPEEDLLQALFRHARARQRPPPELEQATRERLHGQWRAMVGRRRRRRLVASLAVAATVAMAVVLLPAMREPGTDPAPLLAEVVRQHGTVQLADASGNLAATGRALHAGVDIRTGDGAMLGLRWSGGESLRIGEHSRVRLLDGQALELTSGMLYVAGHQAAGVDRSATLEIRTPRGVVTHIGTQYLVRILSDGLDVSVREGRIALDAGGRVSLAEQGQRVTLVRDGEIRLQDIATHGEFWAWTDELAPPFELDGLTIMEFLQQVARESGQQLAFADAHSEQIAREAHLRGRIDLPPMRALDVVLQTTDLEAVTTAGTILVRAR